MMVHRLIQVMSPYIVNQNKLFSGWLVLFIIIWPSCQNSYSQDEVTRYDNLLNPWVLNPALTGSRDNSFNVYANKQWFGFNGAPSFFGFNINGRLAPFDFYTNRMHLNKTSYRSRGKVGLGASLVSDRNGPFTSSALKLNYAYHIQLHDHQLSFGLANDFELYSIHENDMDPLEPDDPKIEGVNRSKILYNPGIGVSYYNDLFEMGIAINNIFNKDIILKHDYFEYPDNQCTYSFQGSYKIYHTSEISLGPGFIISTHEFTDVLYDITGSILYKEDYTLRLTYRSLNYFVIHVGMNIGKYFIIYGYSSPTGSLGRYIYGSHEISLGMKFGAYVY